MELITTIDPHVALAYIGYRGRDIDDATSARLERVVELCQSELVPRGVYKIIPSSEALSIFPGNVIRQYLEGCEMAALMAVTLGMQSEMFLKRESALSSTDGLLADGCASAMVESAADELNKIISKEASSLGCATKRRYSPGYGDLTLACQRALLSACGADAALGIQVNDADLMIPSKSITAVIGFIPE